MFQEPMYLCNTLTFSEGCHSLNLHNAGSILRRNSHSCTRRQRSTMNILIYITVVYRLTFSTMILKWCCYVQKNTFDFFCLYLFIFKSSVYFLCVVLDEKRLCRLWVPSNEKAILLCFLPCICCSTCILWICMDFFALFIVSTLTNITIIISSPHLIIVWN